MTERIVLVGMMGSGKSEVGRLLAAGLGLPLFDLDRMIEEEEGATIAEIFARGGEAEFRRLEKEFVARACCEKRGVLAPGGGAVMDPENRARLHAWGIVVYLRADVAAIMRRLGGGAAERRPLLGAGDLAGRLGALLQLRGPYYEEADRRVETGDADPAQVVERVLAALRGDG